MSDLPRVRDPSDEGMIPIFDLTNAFLNILGPTTWEDMIKTYDINTLDDFSENNVKQDWPSWMWWGFVICVGLGVILLILTPICGCCFCCCRCLCGCCQEQKKVKKGKDPPSFCKTVTCSTILFCLTGCMLAASIIAYVAVGMFIAEAEPTGAVKDIKGSLKMFETFLYDSVDELDQAIFPPFNQTTTEVLRILNDLPEEAEKDLGVETGIIPALYNLHDYTQSLPSLSGNLSAMNTISADLEVDRAAMDTALSSNRNDIGTLLNDSCPSDIETHCTSLKANLPLLTSWAVYYNLSDTTAATTAVDDAIATTVITDVDASLTAFEGSSDLIKDEISDDIDTIETTIKDIETELHSKFNELADLLLNTIDFANIYITIDNGYDTYVNDYYEYVYYALIGISVLAFITACLYLLGIPLGLFCGGGGGTHGANFIMAGISFTFIFSLLFWLIVILFSVIGGGTYLLGCRHITTYDKSMQELERVIRASYGDQIWNLTIREALDNCDNNEALYTALKVEENKLNISEILDLDNTDIEQTLKDLVNNVTALDPITIVLPSFNDSLLPIETETNQIDFQGYFNELNKDETKMDLIDYANDLRAAADATGDPAFATDLRTEADNLEITHTTHVVPMGPERADLLAATSFSNHTTRSISVAQTTGTLTQAEVIWAAENEQILEDSLTEEANEIYDLLDTYTKEAITMVEEDIAQCKPVHDSLTTMVQSPCVYMLDPMNVLWFAFGWFMSFGLLSICFGSTVVGIFRSKAVIATQGKVGAADRYPEYDAYPMVDYK